METVHDLRQKLTPTRAAIIASKIHGDSLITDKPDRKGIAIEFRESAGLEIDYLIKYQDFFVSVDSTNGDGMTLFKHDI